MVQQNPIDLIHRYEDDPPNGLNIKIETELPAMFRNDAIVQFTGRIARILSDDAEEVAHESFFVKAASSSG